MSERVPFRPKLTCECLLTRQGYAGAVIHRPSCKQRGVEWLAQSGDSITPGKRYRWINGDHQWSHGQGGEEFNVVAEVTRVNEIGMVFAYWDQDLPQGENRHGGECCIPNSAVVELVE